MNNSKCYTKDKLLDLHDRLIISFSDGSNIILLNKIERDILVFLKSNIDNFKMNILPEDDFVIRWLDHSKNVSIFKKGATPGDKAVVYMDYTGFTMI